MKTLTFWIENNPETGSVNPFEVWYQVEGFCKKHQSSCKTEDGARKSIKSAQKRNAPYFIMMN